MRAIIQRVSQASVTVDNEIIGSINLGLLVLLGICDEDGEDDLKWLVQKVMNMRIFGDEDGKMNKSTIDVNGSFLVISQFTLYADTKKGNRPSYIRAARPEIAEPLYEKFVALLKINSKQPVETGVFGADMKVNLVNDGPVSIIIDSKSNL